MNLANKLLKHVHVLPPREQARDKNLLKDKRWTPDAKQFFDACRKSGNGHDWVINALPLHDPEGIGGYQHVGKSISIQRGILNKTGRTARRMLHQCLDFIEYTANEAEISVMVYCKSGRHRIRLGWFRCTGAMNGSKPCFANVLAKQFSLNHNFECPVGSFGTSILKSDAKHAPIFPNEFFRFPPCPLPPSLRRPIQ